MFSITACRKSAISIFIDCADSKLLPLWPSREWARTSAAGQAGRVDSTAVLAFREEGLGLQETQLPTTAF